MKMIYVKIFIMLADSMHLSERLLVYQVACLTSPVMIVVQVEILQKNSSEVLRSFLR